MFSEIAISVKNLSKCYQVYQQPSHRLLQMLFGDGRQFFREFWALRDASFDVRRGETVAIIGRNGSGKSTLLQLLCGILTPTSGSVEINGRVAALLELGAGFNPEFTGRENVYMNGAILGLTYDEVTQRMHAIEAFAEIGPFIDQPVKTYSSGMYVRLAFSVAVHTDPQILIVDEALAVGDARFQAKCLKRIKEMKSAGASILFVSHDIGAVRALCDRAIWLESGRVRIYGPVFPITAEYTEYIYAEPASAPLSAKSQSNSPKVKTEDEHYSLMRSQPINHWGTHRGTILSAGIYDTLGNRKSVFTEREQLQVRIQFRAPSAADYRTLSVSFSFKNLAGDDLIVSSTWGDDAVHFSNSDEVFDVCFDLENCLNNGDYLLVAAVEDRSASAVQYYEYIEGAQYFSTVFHGVRFGRFVPRVMQTVKAVSKGLAHEPEF